jgi:serine/threonine-protein kinase RsbT
MLERVPIDRDEDVTTAVVVVQAHARELGFGSDAIQRLGTAVSELARNICKYCQASGGDVVVDLEEREDGRLRFVVQVRDNGPGIRNLDEALSDHYSSSGTLGLGLPGVKRIVDAFRIVSEPGRGTVVTIGMDRP